MTSPSLQKINKNHQSLITLYNLPTLPDRSLRYQSVRKSKKNEDQLPGFYVEIACLNPEKPALESPTVIFGQSPAEAVDLWIDYPDLAEKPKSQKRSNAKHMGILKDLQIAALKRTISRAVNDVLQEDKRIDYYEANRENFRNSEKIILTHSLNKEANQMLVEVLENTLKTLERKKH